MNGIAISKMTFEEARQCADEIKIGISNIGQKLLQLYEGDGWEALGYSNWRECAQVEFGFKQSHVYRLLESAEVVRNIENSPIGGNVPLPTSERQARPLTKLAPELQPVVWQKSVETAPNGKVTAAHVEATAKTFVAPQLPQAPPVFVARTEKEILEAANRIRQEKLDQRREERTEKIIEISQNNKPLTATDLDRLYPIVYADPPWRYEHSMSDNRRIENQYPTMSLAEICALPISNIASPDAVLLLWTTSPKLAESMEVISAWGFTYRTCIVWDKERIGMGYYARQQHELLLIASRGNIPVPEPENRPNSVIRLKRDNEHSVKPHEFYSLIERMYPEYDRIELFARNRREGWAAWGNQA